MPGDDFDDELDECHPARPLLPPEDRVWRHPSELAALAGGSSSRRPLAHRSIWSGPARAGVLAAGVSGAVLATGLVLLGTRLVVAIQQQQLATAGPAIVTSSTQLNRGAVASTDPLQTAKTNPGPAPGTTVMQPAVTTPSVGQITRQVAETAVRLSAASVTVSAATSRGAISGTGLVMADGGYVMTALVLVAGSTGITVSTAGGVRLAARVVGVDSRTGIAVLRATGAPLLDVAFVTGAAGLAAEPPGTVHSLDPVFALSETAEGTDILNGRVLSPTEPAVLPGLPHLLVPIETTYMGGVSGLGSPVIDRSGQLTGIVIGAEGAAGSEAGIVVPMWLALCSAREILADGIVRPGWLGVSGTDWATAGGARHGVRVVSVSPGSSASHAGIRPGDVILAIDGTPTPDMDLLEARVYALTPGTTAHVSIDRDGRTFTAEVVLEHAPAA